MIWIDVTDLLLWRGSVTGVQRVAYSYAKRFANQDARFFAYSSLYDKLVEVELTIVEQRMNLTPEGVTLTKRQVYKKQLRRYYDGAPRPLRTATAPMLRSVQNAFRKAAAMILDPKGDQQFLKRLPVASFGVDDTVVIVGAGWNDKWLMKFVSEKKDEIGFKLVIHLNDILPVYQPHLFADELPPLFKRYVEYSLPAADVVTVISEASKRDVLLFCDQQAITPPTVRVIRLGEDINIGATAKPKLKNLSSRYILAVGTFEIRKNYILLYQMLKLAQIKGTELPQIIIVGKRGWLTGDLAHVIQHDPTTNKKLLLVSGITDAELSWLYEHSMFTVFPSISEGWGLPIAESLVHGKMCIASGVSSMTEIAGDLIEYFSPFDAREVLDLVTKYVADPQLLAKKESQLKGTYKPTSWDESFKEFYSAII